MITNRMFAVAEIERGVRDRKDLPCGDQIRIHRRVSVREDSDLVIDH
jgi:hypothetical protein